MKLLLLLLIITSLVTSCSSVSSWNREDPLGNKLAVINQMIKDEKIIEEDYDKTCFYSNPRADGIKKNHRAYRYVNFYHLKNEAVTYTALEYFMSFPSHFRSLFEMKINKTIRFTKTINSSSKNSINQYYQSTSNFSSLNLEVLHCERTKTNIHREYKVYVSSIRIAPKQLIYDLYHTFASEKFLRDIYKIIKEQQKIKNDLSSYHIKIQGVQIWFNFDEIYEELQLVKKAKKGSLVYSVYNQQY